MEDLDVTETAVKEKKSKSTKSAKKTAAKRKTTTAKTTTRTRKKATIVKVTDEQRLSMIAETAYLKAEKRGFVGGNPEEDWLTAETEVDALLSTKPDKQASA